MTLIRSEQQARLDDLNTALQETGDLYLEAARTLEDEESAAILREIAAERAELTEHIAATVRAMGDLPSLPDRDRETLHALLERLGAAMAADNTHKILEQRLHGERHLIELVEECQQAPLDEQASVLVDGIADHVQEAIARLQALLDAADAPE